MTEVWEEPNKLSLSNGNSIFRSTSSLTPVTSWLFVENWQLSGGETFPALPPEAKLVAQQGLQFIKVPLNASVWACFPSDQAKRRPSCVDWACSLFTLVQLQLHLCQNKKMNVDARFHRQSSRPALVNTPLNNPCYVFHDSSSVHGIVQAKILEWVAIFLLQGNKVYPPCNYTK